MIFIAIRIDFNFILFYYSGEIINISYLKFHLCAMPGVPATIPCVLLSASLFFFLSPQFDCSNFNQLTPQVKKGQKKKDGDSKFYSSDSYFFVNNNLLFHKGVRSAHAHASCRVVQTTPDFRPSTPFSV
jgi:hypothetical protein